MNLNYKKLCYGNPTLMSEALKAENWVLYLRILYEGLGREMSQDALQSFATEIFFSVVWTLGMHDWHSTDSRLKKLAQKISEKHDIQPSSGAHSLDALDRYVNYIVAGKALDLS